MVAIEAHRMKDSDAAGRRSQSRAGRRYPVSPAGVCSTAHLRGISPRASVTMSRLRRRFCCPPVVAAGAVLPDRPGHPDADVAAALQARNWLAAQLSGD
jgi:hypothetical protein